MKYPDSGFTEGLQLRALIKKLKLDDPPPVFDALADSYDEVFTNTHLGRSLRGRVHRYLSRYFAPRQHVLDLGCGTGEDAIRLAGRGIQVMAVDASGRMLEMARKKILRQDSSHLIGTGQLSLKQICEGRLDGRCFDGGYSNFGVLNTLRDRKNLAAALSRIIRIDGFLVLILGGPFCPWDFFWQFSHGQWTTARRRVGGYREVQAGPQKIPVWFPPARNVRRDFSPWFKHIETASLGLWLPPTYLAHLFQPWPGLLHWIGRFEEATAHLTRGWGDHYVTVLQRVGSPAPPSGQPPGAVATRPKS